MCLMKSTPNNFLPTKARPVKSTKITKEIFGAIADENRVALMTLLQ